MTDVSGTTTPAPAAPAAPEPAAPAEKTYSAAEHAAAVEAAIAARFRNAPTKEELAALKAKAAKADELEAAQLTEQQRLEKAAADAKAEAEAVRAELAAEKLARMRERIGAEKGVPADLRDRLIGEDEESIAADAEKVAALVKTQQTAPGTRPGETPAADIDAQIRAATEKGDTSEIVRLERERARSR